MKKQHNSIFGIVVLLGVLKVGLRVILQSGSKFATALIFSLIKYDDINSCFNSNGITYRSITFIF